MNMVTLIQKKRDGLELDSAEISYFINAYTRDDIPDYQAAALLMAIFLRGMGRRETVDLTMAMAESGEELDLHNVAPFVVDKHSSGGVGDKTTLVVQPLVAACGVPVGKMSGRGLGSSGGTLDKMESFPGWSSELSVDQFIEQLEEIDIVLAGQSADLAPADGKLYALRDVTATVASVPLIAGSIMSKKLAAGADGIVLDVKVGSGAFMPTVKAGRDLARIMVNIGKDAGRETVALLSDMNQPLGHAVGNALEVKEAISTLGSENAPADFWAHCLEVAAHMVHLAGRANTLAEAKALVTLARDNGSGLAKFRQMVVAQGGDGALVDDPTLLAQAPIQQEITAPQDGTIAAMDTGVIGWASVDLGGGRRVKTDTIDHAVGFVLPCKIGRFYQKGDTIGVVHARDQVSAETATTALLNAITWSDEPVEPLPHFYDTIK